ncbi:tail fiber domain-containing protein [bacterium]|nr:tail fiber domain-containing protein [bacterium]
MPLTKVKSGGVSDSITLTSPDINAPDIDGGTIDNAVIGGSTAAAGSFTTITATGGSSSNWNTAYGWGDHSTQSYATQTYVGTEVSNLVDSSPAALDTLNELAAALGDDPNFATTVTNSIALKAPLASPSFTGNVTMATGGSIVAGGANDLILNAGESGTPDIYLQSGGSTKVKVEGSNGNVGINETVPFGKLHISDTQTGRTTAGSVGNLLVLEDDENGMSILSADAGAGYILFGDTASASSGGIVYDHSANKFNFRTNDAWNRMILDSSGNLLVGKTATDNTTAGTRIHPAGYASFTIANDYPIIANRLSSDGDIAVFRKDGSTVGSIGTNVGRLSIGSGDTGVLFAGDIDAIYPANGIAARDSAIDLGVSGARFKDLYLSGTANVGGLDATLSTNARGSFSSSIGEVGSGNFALQVTNSAGSALKPLGFRAEDIRFATGSSERMRIDSSGRLGLGVTPEAWSSVFKVLRIGTGSSIAGESGGTSTWFNTNAYYDGSWKRINTNTSAQIAHTSDGKQEFKVAASGSAGGAISWNTAMTVDNSGNLLVGKSANDNTTVGGSIRAGESTFTADNSRALTVGRNTNDGELIQFRKGTGSVGTIGTTNSFYVGQGDTGLGFFATDNLIFPADPTNVVRRDNAIDLGYSAGRFDDIYATNGTIQTSDRNEKQDIAELSDAEQRVAVAAKGLLRKFRWKDSVAEKGDEARTHFGIIAQDLQAAFAAEGLDAGDYAMFISTTWTDEETNEEKTRMGVRYSELLAFIIAAI